MTKTIHFSIYDPSGPSLFKPEANAKAESRTITCSLEEGCPLLKKGQCQCLTLFQPNCPYGKSNIEIGPTKRAKSFYSWIKERKQKYQGIPWLAFPNKKLEFIGDYVYLPYYYMDLCKDVPYVKKCFLHKKDWTVENIVTLIDFLPKALFGGIIQCYQLEEVPKFIAHIQEQDPEMWQKLIEKKPHLNKTLDYIGRKAYLRTLNFPIEWNEGEKYDICWKWDGENLTTTSKDAYNSILGRIKSESIELIVKPIQDATVVVRSNDWVNDKTEFLD